MFLKFGFQSLRHDILFFRRFRFFDRYDYLELFYDPSAGLGSRFSGFYVGFVRSVTLGQDDKTDEK
jgi:hypothetical protein